MYLISSEFESYAAFPTTISYNKNDLNVGCYQPVKYTLKFGSSCTGQVFASLTACYFLLQSNLLS